MPGLTLMSPVPPPFPDDAPTFQFPIVDYELLCSRDEHEIEKLWDAATRLGFW